jgi:hypothetical protein
MWALLCRVLCFRTVLLAQQLSKVVIERNAAWRP